MADFKRERERQTDRNIYAEMERKTAEPTDGEKGGEGEKDTGRTGQNTVTEGNERDTHIHTD